MSGFLVRLVINTAALLILPYIISGIQVSGPGAALVAALALGLVNTIIRPVLILLALPIQFLTLGLFTLVINALMLLLVSGIVDGFEVTGFCAAFWGAIVLSLVSGVLTYAVQR